MAEMEHTPGEWKVTGPSKLSRVSDGNDYAIYIIDDKGHKHIIAETYSRTAEKTYHPAKANAEFIVRACKSHDELLAACEQLVGADWHELESPKFSTRHCAINRIRFAVDAAYAAIKKAKKEVFNATDSK